MFWRLAGSRGGVAALGLGCIVVPAISALAAGPATAASPDGRATARAALITRDDLGRGWTAGPAPRTAPPITCPSFNPYLGSDHLDGSAAGGRMSRSGSGPFVSQTAYVYATPSQAANVATAVMRPGLLRCLASSLTGGSTRAVRFTVHSRRRLPGPRVGVRAAAYRVAGTAAQANQTVNVYLDAIVLSSGRTVTEVSFASFERPPGGGLELRAARMIARRITH